MPLDALRVGTANIGGGAEVSSTYCSLEDREGGRMNLYEEWIRSAGDDLTFLNRFRQSGRF